MDIGRCNHAGKWETMPIDQSTQLAPFCLFIAIIAGRSPFLPGYPWYLSHNGRDRFFDLVPGSEQVEEDRLIHSSLAEFEVVPMNRRFGAVVRWNIEPGASGGQNVQDAVDQPAEVTPRAANVRLRWGGRYF